MRGNSNAALWFLFVLVASFIWSYVASVIIAPNVEKVTRETLPGDRWLYWGAGIWAWGTLGMMAGWATRWWPRTQTLGSVAELALGVAGALLGGFLYVFWFDGNLYVSALLDNFPSPGYLSGLAAFISSILFVMLCRELFRSRTRF